MKLMSKREGNSNQSHHMTQIDIIISDYYAKTKKVKSAKPKLEIIPKLHLKV